MKTGATVAAFARPVRLRQLIGDQHHVQEQAISRLALPRSPCRRSAESCEGRGPSGAPGPSPSRHRADPGSCESQCCLTIETSGQLSLVSPSGELGIEKTALIRVRAGIAYALTEAMDEG